MMNCLTFLKFSFFFKRDFSSYIITKEKIKWYIKQTKKKMKTMGSSLEITVGIRCNIIAFQTIYKNKKSINQETMPEIVASFLPLLLLLLSCEWSKGLSNWQENQAHIFTPKVKFGWHYRFIRTHETCHRSVRPK